VSWVCRVFPALQFTGTTAVLAQDMVANGGHYRLSATAANDMDSK